MRTLLLGRRGQIGLELQRAMAPLGELIALDRASTGLHGDLADPDALAHTVRSVRPDLIVNAAAYTAVDRAEADPELARAVNAIGPAVLAREAYSLGATLVHYGTDYVLDGPGTQARDELAAPTPLSVYGATKLEGEQLVQASGCRHLIFSTSWDYAARGDNFAKTRLRLAEERDSSSVIYDQIGAPGGADLLAEVTALMRCELFRLKRSCLCAKFQ